MGSPIKLFSQTWLIRQSGVAIYRSFASRMTSDAGPVEVSIQTKLQESLKPTHLEVINESNMHNVPKGSESHFKVVVVSMNFENLSLIKRHRMVNDVLKDELAGGVHALSIQAKTPSQWSQNSSVSQSPACLGGMAREMANNKS
ncbi:bolA-like protein DDB_G0274169 isoform X2 [Apostichopus japonicus]|uniref:bolA-like protein DDB_G0274169 isoform X2 n=1 Tax=Stichopus japonicus TaxID=307972 RepID=UPI003AB4F300